MTYLALDIGSKRVGAAISPVDSHVAVPIGVWARSEAEQNILACVRERGVTVVICGLPLSRHGDETEQSEKVRNFCRRLEKRAPGIKIVFIDEYLTSEEAKESGVPKAQLDAMAAVEILKGYFSVLEKKNGE